MYLIQKDILKDYNDVVEGFNVIKKSKYRLNPYPSMRHERYIPHFVRVTQFLIETRGKHKKPMLIMAQDYFTALDEAHKYHGGFRITQIDTKFANETYIKFILRRSYYFHSDWLTKTNRLLEQQKSEFKRKGGMTM
jgi:hypothetical protein